MDIVPSVVRVQRRLVAAAAPGDDATRAAAELLSSAIGPALQLALQEQISSALSEVSREIAPGRADLVVSGEQLDVIVTPPPATAFLQEDTGPAQGASAAPAVPGNGALLAGAGPADGGPGEDAATARVTFRPPVALKNRLEAAAEHEGLSLNAYLVRTLTATLDRPSPPRRPADTGWYL